MDCRPLQPNFFYASLLAVFGIEIMLDWLGRSAAKVSRFEYALLWFTFIAICQSAPTHRPPCLLWFICIAICQGAPPTAIPGCSQLTAAAHFGWARITHRLMPSFAYVSSATATV